MIEKLGMLSGLASIVMGFFSPIKLEEGKYGYIVLMVLLAFISILTMVS